MTNKRHLKQRERARQVQLRERTRRRTKPRVELSPMDELREIDECCRRHRDFMEHSLHGRDEPATAVDGPESTSTLRPEFVDEPGVSLRDPMEDVDEPAAEDLDLDLDTSSLDLDLGGEL